MVREPYLNKQVVLVTGGSRGIGRSIAQTLANHGADIVVNYRKDEMSARDTVEIIEAAGQNAIFLQADVSQPDQAQSLIDQTYERMGRLDILINNVGPFQMKTLYETSVSDWQDMIEGNLGSAFYCTKAALPIMREQQSGHVIFLGAPKADSLRARQNAGAYGIAKTGVLLLAKTIAREEGRHGIKANVVNPGIIDTGVLSEDEKEKMVPHISLRYIEGPQSIANAVAFFLSPEGSYCNGSVIDVDGGLWL